VEFNSSGSRVATFGVSGGGTGNGQFEGPMITYSPIQR
jgi:hypothetical protein